MISCATSYEKREHKPIFRLHSLLLIVFFYISLVIMEFPTNSTFNTQHSTFQWLKYPQALQWP
nr:MAG TPA: hypothetical protein [Caudoviricetes sp.]